MYFYSNNPLGSPRKMEQLSSYPLYNLQHDPSERYNLAEGHPEAIKEIEQMVQKHRATVEPVESQLEKRIVQK
jgi:hypothetical protein